LTKYFDIDGCSSVATEAITAYRYLVEFTGHEILKFRKTFPQALTSLVIIITD